MPFLPIPPYTNSANPVTNITPFTYGDGYTYLSLLEDMRVYLNTMIESVNANTDSANDVVAQFTELVKHVNDAIADYEAQLDNWSDNLETSLWETFNTLRSDMITLVLTTTQTGVIFNPTRGFYDHIGDVVVNVYDFLRTFSYTAEEYDALKLTQDDYNSQFVDAYAYDIRTAQSAITEELHTLVAQAETAVANAQTAASNVENTASESITLMESLAQSAENLLDIRGNVAGTINLANLSKQSIIHCTLIGDVVVTPPENPIPGMVINFEVSQNSVGGFKFTIKNCVTSNGLTSIISTSPNALSEVVMMYDGVRWKARIAGINDAMPLGWNV